MLQQKLQPLITFLSCLGIDQQNIKDISNQLQVKQLASKQVLLPQGQQQKYAFFVLSGVLRACHYTEHGQGLCKEYYFIGELCFLYRPWLTHTTADYQIETISDARVVKVPLQIFDLPGWQQSITALLKQQLLYKEEKEAFLLLKTPEQRYKHLAQHSPQWLSQLNNQQIAEYVGINPVSLSRIKKRLLDR